MMRVLVTGAAGYIGGFAAQGLLDAGHEVVAVDNLWRGHRSSIPQGAEFALGDVRDLDGMIALVASSRPDAIMHFAAATLVPESVVDPGLYYDVNTAGSSNLLVAARNAGVERFVFSSTAAVYGVPGTIPIFETTPLAPINPYGRSKAMTEEMLAAYAEGYGLRYAALRYFNVAGAAVNRGEDHEPETHVIPVILQTLLGKRDEFRVFGTDYPTPDGSAVRDYVHVRDLADAHVRALERLDTTLGAVNLGSRSGYSVLEILAAVERVTGRTVPVSYGPRRDGDPAALIADSTRAFEVLGWRPRCTLDEMIASAWDWFQRNPDGYPD